MNSRITVVTVIIVAGLSLAACTPSEEATPAPIVPSTIAAPQSVTVPDLVGMDGTRAAQNLAGSNLTGYVTSQYDPDVAAGLVISQDPPAGAEVEQWTEVTLIVSLGPPCSDGIELPEGVDRTRVCGSDQPTAGTTTLPSYPLDSSGQFHVFKSPTGNLVCQWYGPDPSFTVACTAVVLETEYPDGEGFALADPSTKRGLFVSDLGSGTVYTANPLQLTDYAASEATPVLEHDQIVVSTDYPGATEGATANPVACLSAPDGITCWDTTTRHGFKLSADQAVVW